MEGEYFREVIYSPLIESLNFNGTSIREYVSAETIKHTIGAIEKTTHTGIPTSAKYQFRFNGKKLLRHGRCVRYGNEIIVFAHPLDPRPIK